MSEEKAFGIKLIRECFLNNITSFQDMKNVSLLNKQMHADVWERLGSKCVMHISNQQITEYTKQIKEPIIKGKYISLSYTPDQKVFRNKKFNQALRGKALKRLPLLEPRIDELWMHIGSYQQNSSKLNNLGLMTPEEIVTIIKSSRNATSIYWFVDGYDEEKLAKLFEEVNDLLEEEENVSFDLAKSLHIDGDSDSLWDFWADGFIHYFPNLENLKVGNHLADYLTISEFLENIDDLGKLETLRGLTCLGEMMGEIWNRFMEKSYSFTKFQVEISAMNISFFKLFLEKYKHLLEDVKLFLIPDFGSLLFPPMNELKKLDFWFRRGHVSSHAEQLVLVEDEDAYPKLREIELGGFDMVIMMVCFRNISKNSGISAKIQKVTARFQMTMEPYFEWIESGQEAVILEQLNQLFPNSNNKMTYEQMSYVDYPNLSQYKTNRNKKRCVIL